MQNNLSDLDSDDIDEMYGMSKTCAGRRRKSSSSSCSSGSLHNNVRKSSLTNPNNRVPDKTLIQPSVPNPSKIGSSNEIVERKLSREIDVDEELSSLVKTMTVIPKSGVFEAVQKSVLYYGWFFSETISDSLINLSESYLQECLGIPQFQRWLDSACALKDIRDPLTYYQPPHKRRSPPLLHTTAKFCGHLPCASYSEKVQPFVGSEFQLAIVGLFFTDKSFGLRVKLSKEQDALFDDERKSTTASSGSGTPEKGKASKPSCRENNGKASKKLRQKKQYPGISFLGQRENFQPTESRAHVTIGCAPKVKPYKAGEDLLDIIDLERRSSSLFHDHKIPGGTLRQYGRHGDYAFVLYPQKRMLAKSVFMPFF